MKKKSSRIYGIVVLACLTLAVCLAVSNQGDDRQVQKQPQTKTTKEVVRLQQESASEVETTTEFVYELQTKPTFPTE
jgi:hypothetical protein